MFNFIKKEKSDRDEKERRKREKKLRKEAKQGVSGGGSMSTEELLRLDEVRRSLKIRGRRKEKEKLPSGITADYSANFFAQLDVDRGVEMDRGTEEVLATANTTIDNGYAHRQLAYNISQSDSSENSLQSLKSRLLPPVPPKPPKRGILKGPRINVASTIEEAATIPSPDSSTLLMRNTLQNEVITYHNLPLRGGLNTMDEGGNISMMNALHIITSPSPSAESLTDTTTNSSFATPPFSLSPVGESQGLHRWSRVQAFEDVSLPLPAIKLVNLPSPRELVIKRQKTPRNDFGFSLRKAICLDRSSSLFAPVFRPVIFAEPGAQGNATGLLPGDRLIKVNGISVEDLPRETIIEMIRNSGESVTVQVQPVAELVELSRRCMTATGDETDRVGTSVSNCNTLRRSASKRFKSEGDDRAIGGIAKLQKMVELRRGGKNKRNSDIRTCAIVYFKKFVLCVWIFPADCWQICDLLTLTSGWCPDLRASTPSLQCIRVAFKSLSS
ncbi:PDZ domain-containing protein [Sergentomyia squamirostris]